MFPSEGAVKAASVEDSPQPRVLFGGGGRNRLVAVAGQPADRLVERVGQAAPDRLTRHDSFGRFGATRRSADDLGLPLRQRHGPQLLGRLQGDREILLAVQIALSALHEAVLQRAALGNHYAVTFQSPEHATKNPTFMCVHDFLLYRLCGVA